MISGRIILLAVLLALASELTAAGRFVANESGGSSSYALGDRDRHELTRLGIYGHLPLSVLTNRPVSRTLELDSILQVQKPFRPGLLKYLPRWLTRSDFPVDQHGWSIYQTSSTDGTYFVFDPRFTLRVDAAKNSTIVRRKSGIQFCGRFQRAIAYSFRFEDNTERGNGPYVKRSQLLEDHYGYVGPLMGGNETYYDATEAYINWTNNWIDVTFGRDRIGWGPGHRTNLLLSGNSPPIDQLRAKVQIAHSTRFTYLVGQLRSSTDMLPDSLYSTPMGWVRYTSEPKWIAAHRLEFAPSDNCIFAVNEAVIWGERDLDAAYLNPLGFFYSAQHDGGDRDNVLMSGDFTFRINKSAVLYGELLIDDLKTSKIGKGHPGNKIGLLLGTYFADEDLKFVEVGMEYTRLEPYVYSHFFPINNYTTWNSSLGADLRPNSDRLEGTLVLKPLNDFQLTSTLGLNQHGSTGGNLGETFPKGFNSPVYFLDGLRERWWSWSTEAEWEPLPGALLSIGYINGARDSAMPNRWFVSVGYRI